MVGKDKTSKAGKGKKALEKEFQEALAAADRGERCTASEHNTNEKDGREQMAGYK